MGNTTNSVMQFDAEATQAVSQLARLASAQREVRQEMRKAAEQSRTGDVAQSQRLDTLSKDYVRNEQAMARNREQLRNLGVQSQATGRSMGNMNMMVGQLSFAMDDFLTVLQMPGLGLIPALRAASNNVSMLLFQFNPMLAIIPSLATATLSLASNLWSASEAEEKLANSTDQAIKKLQEQLEVMRAIENQEQKRADIAFQNELQPLRQKQLETADNRRAIMQEFLASTTFKGEPKRRAREGLSDIPLAELEREFAKAQRQELGGFAADREFAEKFRSRLAVADKQGLAIGQQINLIEQNRAEQDAQRKAREEETAKKEQERRTADQVRQRLSSLSGPLGSFAAKALSEGKSAKDVLETVTGLVGNRFSDQEQQELQKQLQSLIQSSGGAAIAMQLRPDTIDPRRQRINDINLRLQSQQTQLQESLLGQTGGRRRAIERDFERKFGPEQERLELERARLNLELAKEANKGIEDKQDTANEILGRIEELLSARADGGGGVPPRDGRKVSRNP